MDSFQTNEWTDILFPATLTLQSVTEQSERPMDTVASN